MFAASPAQLLPAAARDVIRDHRSAAARLVVFGRQALCGLHGHAMMLHAEPARMSLRCFLCGAETTGWTMHVHRTFRRGAH